MSKKTGSTESSTVSSTESKTASRSARAFVPFANEADVVQVGDLMLENRLDRITISGDVDLTLDQAGLAHARRLHALLGAVLEKLESQDLPAQLPPPDVKTVDNPFS